jgi:hypothetical protein
MSSFEKTSSFQHTSQPLLSLRNLSSDSAPSSHHLLPPTLYKGKRNLENALEALFHRLFATEDLHGVDFANNRHHALSTPLSTRRDNKIPLSVGENPHLTAPFVLNQLALLNILTRRPRSSSISTLQRHLLFSAFTFGEFLGSSVIGPVSRRRRHENSPHWYVLPYLDAVDTSQVTVFSNLYSCSIQWEPFSSSFNSLSPPTGQLLSSHRRTPRPIESSRKVGERSGQVDQSVNFLQNTFQ